MQNLSFAKDTLALSESLSLWGRFQQAAKSVFRGRAAPSRAFAIPPKAPLSAGLDAGRFQEHYAEAFQSRKRRAGQGLFNVWYFYVAPCFLGIAPGELLAKRFLDWQGQPELYALCLFGGALIITPLLMRYRRIHKGHKRYQLFYNAALEACLKEDTKRGQ